MKCYKYILYIGLFILIIGLCAYIFFPLKDHWQHYYTQSEIALKNTTHKGHNGRPSLRDLVGTHVHSKIL